VFSSDDADCLDVETGDAAPSEAMVWIVRQFERGVKRPVLYADASTMRVIISLMNAAGIPKNTLRLWSAHYTNHPHFCGPHTCGEIPLDVDGTQWTSTAMGRSLDQSILDDDFFGGSPKPPVNNDWQVRMMGKLPTLKLHDTDAVGPWYIHRVQAMLTDVFGYKTAIDGVYGTDTENMIRKLQSKFELTVDGVTGPDTWNVLYTGSK
jgi:peptidoglycan hydrolase-like protein with peptidoglycan-binding domain